MSRFQREVNPTVVVITLVCAIIGFVCAGHMTPDDYLNQRNDLLCKDKATRTGGSIELSDAEKLVNKSLMELKNKEIQAGLQNISTFPPSLHFFEAKKLIDVSEVFKIIRKMPKGLRLMYD